MRTRAARTGYAAIGLALILPPVLVTPAPPPAAATVRPSQASVRDTVRPAVRAVAERRTGATSRCGSRQP